MSCELKTGVLYKLAGFFSEKPTVKTWNKRFFVLNKKTMRLQYWTVSEEQVFREEGTISSDPIGDISLVSPNLTIKAAHSEPSMFGTRYPIEISGDSSGKTLILAAADLRTRCDWMEAFIEGQTRHVTNQKRAKLSRDIVRDKNHPEFKSLENQRLIMRENELKIKKYEAKILSMKEQNSSIKKEIPEQKPAVRASEKFGLRSTSADKPVRPAADFWKQLKAATLPAAPIVPVAGSGARGPTVEKDTPAAPAASAPIKVIPHHDVRLLSEGGEEDLSLAQMSVFDLIGSGKLDGFITPNIRNSNTNVRSAVC